jgi:hypothetical protein
MPQVGTVRRALLTGLYLCGGWILSGQSTQGIISGTVRLAGAGTPVPGTQVRVVNPALNIQLSTSTDAQGRYSFLVLPPGEYWIRAEAPPSLLLRPAEVHGLSLPVSGAIEQPIEMSPLSDLFGQRGLLQLRLGGSTQVLRFYGPDVDVGRVAYQKSAETDVGQFEPSASEVLDPPIVDRLPLPGRDIYSALVLLPGVTSDASSVRSLGLSVNGQRPTSSTFLLDGLDNNNHLLTGNFPLPPEAVEEYRVSSNNFSAEYGGTSGYIANAITRRGGNEWHGIGYANTQNAVLDANSFQHNSNSIARQPFVEIQDGFQAGGPVFRRNLFSSTAFEIFRSSSFADPVDYFLPTKSFVQSLPAGSIAASLLNTHPPIQFAPSSDPNVAGGDVILSPPIHLNRWSGLERLDYVRSPSQQILVSLSAGSLDRPDFNWTPYGEGGLRQSWTTAGAAITQVWTPTLTGEFRAGVTHDGQDWGIANQDLPQIDIADPTAPMLPGANGPQSRGVAYRSHSHGVSATAGIAGERGRNIWKAGGGFSLRFLDQTIQFENDGRYAFLSSSDFAEDQPFQVEAPLSRIALKGGTFASPNTSGGFRYGEFSGYFQDDFRATSRLTITAGLRYEWFGAPQITSTAPIGTLNLSISSPEGSVPNSSVVPSGRQVFAVDSGTVSGRLGLSYSPHWFRDAMTIRGGYGMFRDPLFDNLWLTVNMNDVTFGDFSFTCGAVANYLSLAAEIKQHCEAGFSTGFFNLTAFAPMHTPLVHSFFTDLSIAPGRGWKLSASGTGSAGMGLIDTDVLNRNAVNGSAPNFSLPQISYRGNQASSIYAALSLSAQYSAPYGAIRAFYTWSHSIDDQSDALLGDFFDLGFSNQTDRTPKQYYGAFTLPNTPGADRGNSDFDQRQNFVVFSYWDLPSTRRRHWDALSRGWKFAETFVVRSGLPYSVYAGIQNCQPVCNTRANLIDPAGYQANGSTAGGEALLNAAAFSIPADGTNGNTGRNEFRGPGFWNLDVSLSRTFLVPGMGERGRIELRADAFNVLNHANLQAPQPFMGAFSLLPTFGDALFGRTGNAGFPALTPFVENARQIQVLARFRF